MKINTKEFRVRPGKKVKLREWPTSVKPLYESKKQYQELLCDHVGGCKEICVNGFFFVLFSWCF
jgi:hypothetical protein